MRREGDQTHTGDPSYGQEELIEDLQYKCTRDGIEWDEELVKKLLEEGKR